MKKRIISFVLMINILVNLSGCIIKNNNNNVNEEIVTLEIEDNDILNDFINKINDINPIYKYSLHYPDEYLISKYQRLAKSTNECTNTNTDYSNLSNIIINNTIEKYGTLNGLFIIDDITYNKEEYSKLLEINSYTKIALKRAINNIFKNSTNNISEDICKLKDICIINDNLQGESDSYILGIYDNDNLTIKIDYRWIYNLYILDYNNYKEKEISFIDYLTMVIEHELNHVRQYICSDRIENGQKYVNISMKDSSFMLEATAESELHNNFSNISPTEYSYYLERNLESLLLLTTVFKDNKNIVDYYNAIYDSNLNKLYEFFELKSKEDYITFYNIIYTMNTITCRTDLSSALIHNGYDTIGKIKEELGNYYLIDIMKISMKDLVSSIDKNNLSLDECIIYYLFIKSYMVYDVKFDGFTNQSINNIENAYVNYLSKKYDVREDEIKELLTSDKYYEILDNLCGEVLFNDYDNYYKDILNRYPIMKNIIWNKYCFSNSLQKYDNSKKLK